jgi:surface polysaccharide O-acyltransferase-like enzyme
MNASASPPAPLDAGPRPAARAPAGPGAAAPAVAWKNIGVLRGVAMFLVVFQHSTHWVFSIRRITLETQPMSALEGLVEVIGRGLSPVAMPAFLFVTGYFVARFSASRPAAWTAARRMAVRYTFWTIPGFAFFALRDHRFDVQEALYAFVTGGPFISYWFFPLIVALLLAAPALVRACERWPRAMLGLGVAIQAALVIAFYVEMHTGWSSRFLFNHAPYMRLPFFLYGVLFSRRADPILAALGRHRRVLGATVAALAAATVAEAIVIGSTARDGSPAAWGEVTFNFDGIFLHLLQVAFVAWLISVPSRDTRFRAAAQDVGLHSMAILLLSDAVLIVFMTGLWQAGYLFGPLQPEIPPTYMLSAWWLPLMAAAGVLVPVLVQRGAERVVGKRVGNLLFG